MYGILNVTGNSISWSSGSASVHTESAGIGTYYSRGSYTVIQRDFTFGHDSNGNFSAYIGASISTTYKSGDTGGVLTLPHINRQSKINSFTGTNINSDFSATYTAYTNYENKLRISIPHVVRLQTFNNYVSGSNVRLSNAAKQLVKQHTSAKTVTIGGVIETWNGETKIGESEEINIPIEIPKGVRLKINGTWKEAIPYVRVNGSWKETVPYARTNSQWKEGI